MRISSPNRFELFIWLLLAILALANIGKALRYPQNHDQPVDFRQLYLAGRLILEDKNPYDDAAIKTKWEEMAIQGQLTTSRAPGFPQNGVVYPLHTLYAFAPVAALGWNTARLFWWVFTIIAFIIVAMLAQAIAFPNWSTWKLVVLMLVFKGTMPSLLIGQPLWIALMGFFFAMYADRHNKHFQGALGVFFVSLKISLLFPLLLWWLIRRRWKMLWTSVGVLTFVMLLLLLISPDVAVRMTSMLSNMQTQWASVYEMGAFNSLAVNITELGPLFFPENKPAIIFHIAGLALSCGLAILVWGFTRPQRKLGWHDVNRYLFSSSIYRKDIALLSLFLISSLLWSYHLIYDAVPVFIFAVALFRKHTFYRILMVLAILPLVLPVNGLLGADPWSIHLPVTLAALFLLTITGFFTNLFQRK
ncbi:MAG: glycosyltransferase 87 family protein [Bacteroidia bacterium]